MKAVTDRHPYPRPGLAALLGILALAPSLAFALSQVTGVLLLTGRDHVPRQTDFALSELADPYVSRMPDGSAIISGTAPYHLRFKSIDDIARGGPYEVIPNGIEGAEPPPWDLKPALWAKGAPGKPARLWNPKRDAAPPLMVWYGGQMRAPAGEERAAWPRDNHSRDVFAFTRGDSGRWVRRRESIFASRGDWPRRPGDYRGHRYGHQIVMLPRGVAAVFYEEVTRTRADGSPAVTRIFMDEMSDPLTARGKPVELVSPINPRTGRAYPSALREDGSALVEGPLYFRFDLRGEEWEAIGFSAGSFYGRYPSCFAYRRVVDGRRGKPYRLDLSDEGTDLHDAGAELGAALKLAGGPGRPAVILDREGRAVRDGRGALQLLFHAYRREILTDHDFKAFPARYRLDQMFRSLFHASLRVRERPGGALRFDIVPSEPGRAVRSLREVSLDAPPFDPPLQPRLSAPRVPLAGGDRAARNQAQADGT